MDRDLSHRVILLALVVLALASCSPAAPIKPTLAGPALTPGQPTGSATLAAGGGPLLVVFNPVGDDDLQNAFLQAAAGLGARAQKTTVDVSAAGETRQVNDALQAGARGIAIRVSAPAAGLGAALSSAAQAAGAPLLTMDTALEDASSKPLPVIRFDDQEMGQNVGSAAARLLVASGWLPDSAHKMGVLSLEVNTQSFCKTRTDAEKAALQAAGVPADMIFSLGYDLVIVDSQANTGAVLKAHPDITRWVVVGCTDSGVAGSLKAMDAAGIKPADIIAVGIDASQACLAWVSGKPTGFKGSLNISRQDMGRLAAGLLYDAVVNHKPLPAVTIVPTAVIDASNFESRMDSSALANCGI